MQGRIGGVDGGISRRGQEYGESVCVGTPELGSYRDWLVRWGVCTDLRKGGGKDAQVNAAAEAEVWLLDMGGDVGQLFGCPGLSSFGVGCSDSDQDGALDHDRGGVCSVDLSHDGKGAVLLDGHGLQFGAGKDCELGTRVGHRVTLARVARVMAPGCLGHGYPEVGIDRPVYLELDRDGGAAPGPGR